MGRRADNKVDFKMNVDKTLKEEFRHDAYANNTDMTKEVVKFIENYVKRAKKQASKSI